MHRNKKYQVLFLLILEYSSILFCRVFHTETGERTMRK